MNCKNWFLVVAVGFVLNISAQTETVKNLCLCINQAYEVDINGLTNASSYSCDCQSENKTRACGQANFAMPKRILVKPISIQLPINHFVCDNRKMTADFAETLQQDKHPNIDIEILQLHLTTSLATMPTQQNVHATINVHIAGVNKVEEIKLDNLSYKNNQLLLRGGVQLRMSDFNLETPSALFGLIKVKDELDVNFTFNLCVD